jgi:hypothetical protein
MVALAPAPVEYPVITVYSIVYYLMFEDPAKIKIGTSTTPLARIKTLEKKHGPSKLIACHPGHIREEKIVHARFKDLALGGEFFAYRGRLIEHVKKVKQRHPEWRTLPEAVALTARWEY